MGNIKECNIETLFICCYFSIARCEAKYLEFYEQHLWDFEMVCMFLGFCIFSLPTGELCQIILKPDFDNLVKRIKIESKKGKKRMKKRGKEHGRP